MWWLGQRWVVERAACFHATSEDEYRSIRQAGFDAPVSVIPNGVDLPPESATAFSVERTTRRLVFFGRLHPVKGVDILVRAWSQIASRHPDWQVDVVGPDEGGYGITMRHLAAERRAPRIHFFDAVYGAAKWQMLSNASLVVLPSRTENFGMSVAEALASSVPVVVSKNAPWEGLDREGCGWWVEHGVDALAASLDRALATPEDDLRAMGRKGRAWMARDFSWPTIGKKMADTYAWLVRGAPMPPFVRVN